MSALTLLAIAAVTLAIIVYQGYVTTGVLKGSSATGAQKAFQTILVWALPAVGVAIVHAFLVSDTEIPVKRDDQFIPNPGSDGAG